MVSQSLDDLSIRQSMLINESNASSTNTDSNIDIAVTGLFVSPSTVTGRDTVTGLPLVASNEYGKMAFSTIASVTQATDITTGVTANGNAGVITTQAASAAASASDTFTVTNSSVTASSVILLQIMDYSGTLGTNGAPIVYGANVAAGSFDIVLYNADAANALAGTFDIGYQVIG